MNLPPDGSTRTMCEILGNMRKCYETRNFAYLPGLIEEAQYRAERMENALELYSDGWGGLTAAKKTHEKLKREIKKLENKKESLEET